ncbi:sensor histidine kinase, partial [Catenulispora pinisilvae]|uniref:sensor histidine kinase n=1 Tax=Catenulispora pinisilvae TaxID=2705253 RepID=UPI001891E66D
MSTPTDTANRGPADRDTGSKDPYIRGTDETVLLDLRELRAQEAAEQETRQAAAGPGTELERYHGSHRRDAVLYADGGTAIPLDRVREVCHDLRQPVAAILMLASAAELRPDVPERVREVLQEIMTQTEDISSTVRQFLDDAKQGVDGLGEPVPCNVAGLAAESVERWRATFDGDLALAAAEDPLHVTVDPVLFKRALGNVLSNGTRAAGEAGRVQVTVRRFETAEGERAVIEVDDSGPGFGNIPAGHGLGLAVVRRTIEAAGGAVEFAEGPLGGALVRLVLPVTPIRPLSADDELTKTFHGEITLSELAAQLAMGNLHKALADFDDDDDDEDDGDDFDFAEVVDVADVLDVLDVADIVDNELDANSAPAYEDTTAAAPVASGHALTTRFSAWPEPMAISGTPEQLAIGGAPEQANPFASENRSYFGLPTQPTAAEREIAPAANADRGFFGLPLKNDVATPTSATTPAQIAAPTPRQADVSAHPVPAGLFSPRRAGSLAQGEIAAATPAATAQPPAPHRTAAPTIADATPAAAHPARSGSQAPHYPAAPAIAAQAVAAPQAPATPAPAVAAASPAAAPQSQDAQIFAAPAPALAGSVSQTAAHASATAQPAGSQIPSAIAAAQATAAPQSQDAQIFAAPVPALAVQAAAV